MTATDTPLDGSPVLDASVTFRIGSPPPPRRPNDDDSSSEDTSPSVTGPTHVEYAENATQPVAAYTATHLQTPTWRVTGPDAGAFALSPSGVLRFRRPPDYEAPTDTDRDNRYTITVHAAAGTTTAQLAVTITVTDVGEHGGDTGTGGGTGDDDDSTGDGGSHGVDSSGAPCIPDRHGGSPAQATGLYPPTPLAGAICPAGDQDYFQFYVPHPGLVFVETRGPTSTAGTVWQHGLPLGQAVASGQWQNFRLGVPVQAGPVVVALSGQGNATGAYDTPGDRGRRAAGESGGVVPAEWPWRYLGLGVCCRGGGHRD